MSIGLGGIGLTGDFALGDNAWGEAMNANLRRLSFLAQAVVLDNDLSEAPVSPSVGDAYILPSTLMGEWAANGETLLIAVYYPEGWTYYIPEDGWRVWVVREATEYRFRNKTIGYYGWYAI